MKENILLKKRSILYSAIGMIEMYSPQLGSEYFLERNKCLINKKNYFQCYFTLFLSNKTHFIEMNFHNKITISTSLTSLIRKWIYHTHTHNIPTKYPKYHQKLQNNTTVIEYFK